MEQWGNRSITVIGRADHSYPRRFKQRLKRSAPPLLYACGNLELLHRPALAVVGSRSTPEALLQQAQAIGVLAAEAGVVMASGTVQGVEETAMLASLAAGGCAIGVVADSLEQVIACPLWRQALLEGRLLLLSSDAPSARFEVGRAMARNKLIYALADAALVVSAARGEGVTWTGVTEQLQSLHFCPVYVLSDPSGGPGLAVLSEIGAHPWPEPPTAEALRSLLHNTERRLPTAGPSAPIQQGSLLETAPEKPPQSDNTLNKEPETAANSRSISEAQSSQESPDSSLIAEEPESSPAVALATFVDMLVLQCIHEPISVEELAVLLDVSKTEVRRWCQRLVEQGQARKLSSPVRYVRG